MIVLGLEYTASLGDFFLLFNSATSVVTAYNVGVFKQLSMIQATPANEILNLSNIFSCVVKV